jgi:SAM-dependent methyltransferase
VKPSPPSLDAGLPALQEFWNQRYDSDDFAYGTLPNEFLVQALAGVNARGRARCLADGEGRNGVWLARQGWQVLAVDLSARGLQKAQQLAQSARVTIDTAVHDLTTFEPGRACWDLIVSILLHLAPAARRRLFRACAAALAPGGRFVYAGFGPEPGEEGRYPALADIKADLTGCAFEHSSAGMHTLNEGRLHVGERLVVQVVARRSGP